MISNKFFICWHIIFVNISHPLYFILYQLHVVHIIDLFQGKKQKFLEKILLLNQNFLFDSPRPSIVFFVWYVIHMGKSNMLLFFKAMYDQYLNNICNHYNNILKCDSNTIIIRAFNIHPLKSHVNKIPPVLTWYTDLWDTYQTLVIQ